MFGDDESVREASGRLIYDVLALYEADYINAWDELLADLVRVPLGADPQEASRILGYSAAAAPRSRCCCRSRATIPS